jgi:GR25 family glycosyltransferase involved in LPS biosynthesis
MKTYAIVMKDHEISEFGYKKLCSSSKKVNNDFEITRFDAILPEDVDRLLSVYDIKWNYPWQGEVTDFASGLTKRAYVTTRPKARIAAALSHYTLWMKASMLKDPILILEHDACFTYKLDIDVYKCKGDIIGINNPLGCTRKANDYYLKILQNQHLFQLAPTVDIMTVPQGLAGNSAYIIKPQGATHMLNLVKEYGLWPNDALMCKQLVPNLYVTRKFFTTIQNLKSTTTL